MDFPGGVVIKSPPANAGDIRHLASIPGSGRSPGEGHGNPLQDSCLENPMDGEAPKGYKPRGSQRVGCDWATEYTHKHSYFIYTYVNIWASPVAQTVKNLPAMWKTWVRSLGWEDPMEEGMTTHSSILAWRIPMDRGTTYLFILIYLYMFIYSYHLYVYICNRYK